MSTRIGWTDATWNPVTGCTAISAGCANCFAKTWAARLKGMGQAKYNHDDPFAVRCHPEELQRSFGKKPKRVFVCSMGDLFHKDVPWDFIGQVLDVIRANPHITFQILTKRADLMNELFNWSAENEGLEPEVTPNLWLGVTAENQETADERIPLLLDTPAAVRFVSVEPMLEAIGFTPVGQKHIDWIIVGPETGPGARRCDSRWLHDVVAQCEYSHIPLFIKTFPMPNGKVSHNIAEWPAWAQVQEFPKEVTK